MPVSYDLGTAAGKVVIDFDDTGTKKATEGMDKVGESADKLGKKTTDVQPLIKQTSTAFLTMGTVIAGALGLALKAATDFEFGLSAIQAVSGATAAEMDLINKAALRIGADTKYSAAEAASAMEELLKAGISVTDVLNGAADATTALAAAGEIELPQAASIIAAAMNQFKIAAEDVVDVTDILAGAANASATGVSEIGAALTFVGPVANAAGLSLRDTALAIALFANNGIDGMRAGTGLRAMLSSLSSPTNLAADQLKALGLITEDGANQFFDATGKIKPFNEIAGLLRDTLGGLNEQQLLQFADAVVGRENMSTLSAIVNTSAEDFDKLATSIDSVSAADVAATRMQNLAGQVELLRGSVETMAIRFGQAMLPAITSVAAGINDLVDKFSALSDEQIQTIATIAGVTAGALLFAGAAGKIALGMMDLRKNILLATGATTLFSTATAGTSVAQMVATAATRAWGLAMKALPILAIIGLIAGLVAAVVEMNGGWDGVVKAAKPALDAIVAAFKPLMPVVEQIAGLLEDVFKAAIDAIAPVLSTLAKTIFPILITVLEAVAPLIAALAEIVAAILTPILAILGPIIGVVAEVLGILLEALMPVIEMMLKWSPLMLIILPLVQLLADGLSWLAGVISDFFAQNVNGTSQAGDAWAGFVGWLTEIWNGIIAFFAQIILNIQNYFNGLFSTVNDVWNNIMAVVQPVVDWFVTYVGPLIEAVVNLIAKLFNYLWSVVQFVWQSIFDFVSGIVQAVSDFIATVWGAIIGFVAPIFEAIFSFLSGIFTGIYNFVSGIVNSVASFIRDVWNGLISIVSGIFTNVYNAIKDPLQDALDFIGGIYDQVVGFFSNAGQWLLDAGANIIGGLITGIENALGGLTDILNGITGMIPEEKGPPAKDKRLLEPAGSLIMQGLINGIREQVPELASLLGAVTTGISADMQANIAAAYPRGAGNQTRIFNYNAAPGGAQLGAEDELFTAMKRAKVVVPGW